MLPLLAEDTRAEQCRRALPADCRSRYSFACEAGSQIATEESWYCSELLRRMRAIVLRQNQSQLSQANYRVYFDATSQPLFLAVDLGTANAPRSRLRDVASTQVLVRRLGLPLGTLRSNNKTLSMSSCAHASRSSSLPHSLLRQASVVNCKWNTRFEHTISLSENRCHVIGGEQILG